MKIKYLLLVAGILISCQSQSLQALEQLLENFESELFLVFPDYATAMGKPNAIDILIIPTKKRLKENLDFCQGYLEEFKKFKLFDNQEVLNQQRIEKIEILEGMIRQMTGPRSPFNDPGFYDVYPALAWRVSQLTQYPDSINTNLLLKTLTKVPIYFSHAKANLDDPNISRTIAAIDLQEKAFNFLRTTVGKKIGSLPQNTSRKKITIAHESAKIAVQDYTVFCKSILIELKKLEQVSDD